MVGLSVSFEGDRLQKICIGIPSNYMRHKDAEAKAFIPYISKVEGFEFEQLRNNRSGVYEYVGVYPDAKQTRHTATLFEEVDRVFDEYIRDKIRGEVKQ